MNGFYNTPLVHTAEPSITSSSKQQALGVIQDSKTRQELAGYFHACMFSPAPATLLRAVKKGQLRSWPGVPVSLIYEHITKSIATSMDHPLHQQKISRKKYKLSQPFPYQNLLISLLPRNYPILAPTPCTTACNIHLIYVKHIPIRQENFLYSLPEVITTCLSSTTMIQTPSCQYH